MLKISHLLLVSVFAWSVLAQINTNSEIRKKSAAQSKGICIPPEHKQTAVELLKNIKYEVEPCDDFYQFACGKFLETTQIPEGKKHVDAFTYISGVFKQQIRKILAEERAENDPNYFNLPKKFFQSCMNRALIDNLADQPARRISNLLGGWPVVVGEKWDSDNSWKWQDLAKKLRRLGFSTDYLITFNVKSDVKNKTRKIIYLYKPTLVFKSDFNKTSLEKYYNFMVNTAISFGAKKAAAIRELSKSFRLELDLVDISQTVNNINYGSSLLSIKQLQDLYPYVQWLDFINALLPEDLTVDENEIIYLLSRNFFDKLGSLLARTDKRTIANYMMWKFHYLLMNFLSKGFRNRFQTFSRGAPSQENTLNECVRIVSQSLPLSVNSLYAHKYFNETTKTTVTKIFDNLRNAFSHTLDESQWLDVKTKEEAKRKLHSMKAVIGFADEVYDIEKVEDYYRDLKIDENKYLESYLNIRTFAMDKHFGTLRTPANEIEWLRDIKPILEGLNYGPKQNKLYVRAGSLQGQVFNIQRPSFMNYGSIGFIMGHEITHGFCGTGCKYCPDGEKREWWQRASVQALSEREKCFIEQYSNYTDKQTGLKINGLNTLKENMADNSGVKLSYLTYKQWQATHGEELRLPGVKYTPQQLFWISFAQTFCGKFTSEAMVHHIKNGTHTPHEFRVLGVLRNMKDFSKDFHCPENSPMNPLKKCEVW